MDKFLAVYAGENKKMFRGKALFVVLIIMAILVLILTIAFEIIIKNKDIIVGNTNEIPITSPEQGIAYYQNVLHSLEQNIAAGNSKPSFNNNPIRTCKRMITYYKYLQEHNMSVNEALPYHGGGNIKEIASSSGYVTTIMQVSLLLATILIIMFSASNITGELNSGALKMQLLRPVSRQAMLTAKASSAMTGGLFIYGWGTLIAIVYSLIRFKTFMPPQVVFFNDTTAGLISSGSMFVIQFFSGIMSMVFYCSLTYAIGFLSNSKSAAVGVPLGIMTLGSLVSVGLGYICIGYIDPLYNFNFMETMSTSSAIYAGSNVLVSVAIILAYIAVFITYNYHTFKKRDLN